jgi:hypothetical protein
MGGVEYERGAMVLATGGEDGKDGKDGKEWKNESTENPTATPEV